MKTLREFRESLKQALADHEMRHRPSKYRAALFDSVHFIPKDAWNSVVPPSRLFQRPKYLAALEASGSETMELRYALLYDGARPVAAATFQIHEFSGEALGSRQGKIQDKNLRGKVGQVLRRAADRVSVRLLMCGNAFVTGEHGFCVAEGVPLEDAFDGLAEVIYRIRRADKLRGQITGVLVKDFYDDGGLEDASGRLRHYGYREFVVDPQMVIVLRPEWQSFDDYVAAMTKKYRARVRSARKKGRHLERRVLDRAAIESHDARIQELFLAVHEKAKFRIAELPPRYFQALASSIGDRFSMHGYFLAGEMVGFTSCLQWGTRLEGHYLGLDYAHNVEHGIYQNILYDDVAEAFERGCQELFMGRTALEIKSSIGAVPRPVRCFMRHRNPASNSVVKPMFGFVKPTPWTPRNPFGAEAAS